MLPRRLKRHRMATPRYSGEAALFCFCFCMDLHFKAGIFSHRFVLAVTTLTAQDADLSAIPQSRRRWLQRKGKIACGGSSAASCSRKTNSVLLISSTCN